MLLAATAATDIYCVSIPHLCTSIIHYAPFAAMYIVRNSNIQAAPEKWPRISLRPEDRGEQFKLPPFYTQVSNEHVYYYFKLYKYTM